MSTKTISMCQGKGSLSHNNREFTAKNIEPFRTADNITFVQQDLGETYHHLFDEAVERYNARQKRTDRKISDYFQHLFSREPCKSIITGTNKQKSFYEDLVQIGTKDDATLLLNSGVDLKVVSEHLGHCDIGVTANIYADVLKSTNAKVADLVALKLT